MKQEGIAQSGRSLLFSIGNCAFPIEKKTLREDAHSREWKMSQVTALGARVLQAELFLGFVWIMDDGKDVV